jgi:protein-ribulosamine 3-kinase
VNHELDQWLIQAGMGSIVQQNRLSGGSINEASRLLLDTGSALILKQHPKPPANMYRAEAEGLIALSEGTSLRVPQVIHTAENFILLEDLGSGRQSSNFWQQLAYGLAELHSHKVQHFGFSMDNYCGSTPQINTPLVDGHEFFAMRRLLHLGRQCLDAGLLDSQTFTAIEHVAENLSTWIPNQAAVLIHGDLWSGNIHCDESGQPALIDPAAYWGWAEAELAMTLLFGGFPQEFYQCYGYTAGINEQWRERAGLYNLYHLLNHLLLFGSSYLGQIRTGFQPYLRN